MNTPSRMPTLVHPCEVALVQRGEFFWIATSAYTDVALDAAGDPAKREALAAQVERQRGGTV